MTICAKCDRAIPRHHNTHYWHHPDCPSQSEIDWDCCPRTSTYHPDCCPRPDCVQSREETRARGESSLAAALASLVISGTDAMVADLRDMKAGRYTGRHSQAWLDGNGQ